MTDKKEAACPLPVTYAGDSLQKKLLLVGFSLIVVGLLSMQWNSGKVQTPFSGNRRAAKAGPAAERLKMCEGVSNLVLTRANPSTQQYVFRRCFTQVMVPPNTKVTVNLPGAGEVCFWRNNRCLVRVKSGSTETKEEPIPNNITAVLLRGDPGLANVHLLIR